MVHFNGYLLTFYFFIFAKHKEGKQHTKETQQAQLNAFGRKFPAFSLSVLQFEDGLVLAVMSPHSCENIHPTRSMHRQLQENRRKERYAGQCDIRGATWFRCCSVCLGICGGAKTMFKGLLCKNCYFWKSVFAALESYVGCALFVLIRSFAHSGATICNDAATRAQLLLF